MLMFLQPSLVKDDSVSGDSDPKVPSGRGGVGQAMPAQPGWGPSAALHAVCVTELSPRKNALLSLFVVCEACLLYAVYCRN